jgi:hypothetical protein
MLGRCLQERAQRLLHQRQQQLLQVLPMMDVCCVHAIS